jgi:hypothetical protein
MPTSLAKTLEALSCGRPAPLAPRDAPHAAGVVGGNPGHPAKAVFPFHLSNRSTFAALRSCAAAQLIDVPRARRAAACSLPLQNTR